MKLILAIAFCLHFYSAHSWGSKQDRVRLEDIKVLTLKSGSKTAARRVSPIPQLSCVGDTELCNSFAPDTVQCFNRGSDGYDIQWECKADLDNSVRFGDIDVSCERYRDEYDEDYILRGSCGLRYSLKRSKGGFQQNNNHGDSSSDSYGWSSNLYKKKSSVFTNFADVIVYAIIILVIFVIFKSCVSSNHEGQTSYSSTNDDYPSGNGGGSGWSGGRGNEGYGWFGGSPRYNSYDDASCGNRSYNRGSGGGGFWTGAAAGGLLGYFLGNQGQGNRSRDWWGRPYNAYSSSENSGFTHRSSGGGFFGGSGGSTNNGGSSSGTRVASGFGGTSRR